MADLHPSEIRELEEAELDEHLVNLRRDIMKIKGGIASGGVPEDIGKTREIRRTIARILTIKHEKQKRIEPGSKKRKRKSDSKEVATKK